MHTDSEIASHALQVQPAIDVAALVGFHRPINIIHLLQEHIQQLQMHFPEEDLRVPNEEDCEALGCSCKSILSILVCALQGPREAPIA